MIPYFENQRIVEQKRQEKLAKEASGMSTSELVRSLSWQQALSEHGDETGCGNPSSHKLQIIENELRSRGVR